MYVVYVLVENAKLESCMPLIALVDMASVFVDVMGAGLGFGLALCADVACRMPTEYPQ